MRFTIRLKLGLTFATIIALSVVASFLGISGLNALNSSMRQLVAGPVERMQIGEEMFIDLLQVLRAEKNMILYPAPDQVALNDKAVMEARLGFATKLEHGERIASRRGQAAMGRHSRSVATIPRRR